MNEREIIEKKDAELLKSVRAIIHEKESEKEKVAAGGKKRRNISFLVVIIGVAALFYIAGFPFKGPDTPKRSFSETLQTDTYRQAIEITPPAPEQQIPAPGKGEYSDSKTIPAEQERSVAAVSKPPRSQADTVYYKDPPSTTASIAPAKKAEPEIIKEKSSLQDSSVSSDPDVWVAKKAACTGVTSREPVGIKNNFTIYYDKYVYIYTDVRTETPPKNIQHIYYLNNEEFCTVPLSVNYPRTRTWSRVRLNDEKRAGQYRVDIVDDRGGVLGSLYFTVTL